MATRILFLIVMVASLLVSASSTQVHAETGPYAYILPDTGTTMPVNPRIYIVGNQKADGYHWLLESLLHECRCYHAYLVSDKERVPLERIAFRRAGEAQSGDEVLVLRPKRQLQRNRQYRFQIHHGRSKNPEPFSEDWVWTTGARADRKAPTWAADGLTVDGKGVVQVSLADPEEIVHLAIDLRPVGKTGTRKRTRMLIDGSRLCPTREGNCPDRRERSVCDWAHFEQSEGDVGKRFRARVTLIDGAGNRRAPRGTLPIVQWTESLDVEICVSVAGKGEQTAASKKATRSP